MTDITGKVAVVTGAGRGIGRAIAASLAGAGARVAITGRDERKLAAAAAELGAHPIRADVADERDVIRTYEEFLGEFGHLDVLVNNAGVGAFTPLVDTSRDDFDAVFATNVTGAMLMAREAAKHFVARSRGGIVNICSTAGVLGRRGHDLLREQVRAAQG
jgi:NAD(P)-dependent dehydrogenase (short-subunit alcohol dehydrogenase family)